MGGIFDPDGDYLNGQRTKNDTTPDPEVTDFQNYVAYMKNLELAKQASSNFYNLGDDNYSLNATGEQNVINKVNNSNPLDRELQFPTSFYGVDAEAYNKYGVGVANHIDYNKQRAKNQSGWEQLGHSAVNMAATALGEAISGVGSMGAISKSVVQELTNSKTTFDNGLMQLGKEIKDKAKEANPIYRTNPNKSMDVGDPGWWYDNLPSVASSIGMFIPAGGAMLGLKLADKAAKAGKLGSRIMKAAEGLDAAGNITKDLTKLGVSSVIMRNAENMSESIQGYNQAKASVYNELNSLTPDELSTWKAEHPDIVQTALKHGQKDDADGLSNIIATKAAWNIYKIDAANVVFDAIQLAPLFKGLRITPRDNLFRSSVLNAQRASIGSEALSKGAALANDVRYHLIKSAPLEIASESVEELVNGIAQKEGASYANQLLTNKDRKDFSQRLGDYLGDPQIWEQAFWGAIGGAAFSGFTRISNAINNASNPEGDMHSTKQQTSEIASRNIKLAGMMNEMANINKGINPTTGEQFVDDDEQAETIHDFMYNTASSMAMDANRRGTTGLLVNQLRSKDYADMFARTNEVDPNEASHLLNKVADIVVQTENFYKGAASKIYNSSTPEYIKDIIISKMVNLQSNANNFKELTNKYEQRVAQNKLTNDFISLQTKASNLGLSVDEILDYNSIITLQKELTKQVNNSKDKDKTYVNSKLKPILASLNSKLVSLNDTFKELDSSAIKEISDQLSSDLITDNAKKLVYSELSGKLDEDYFNYKKDIKDNTNVIKDIVSELADEYNEKYIKDWETKINSAVDEKEITKHLEDLDGIIKTLNDSPATDPEVKDRVGKTVASLSSLRGRVKANYDAMIIAKNNIATNTSQNEEEPIVEEPVVKPKRKYVRKAKNTSKDKQNDSDIPQSVITVTGDKSDGNMPIDEENPVIPIDLTPEGGIPVKQDDSADSGSNFTNEINILVTESLMSPNLILHSLTDINKLNIDIAIMQVIASSNLVDKYSKDIKTFMDNIFMEVSENQTKEVDPNDITDYINNVAVMSTELDDMLFPFMMEVIDNNPVNKDKFEEVIPEDLNKGIVVDEATGEVVINKPINHSTKPADEFTVFMPVLEKVMPKSSLGLSPEDLSLIDDIVNNIVPGDLLDVSFEGTVKDRTTESSMMSDVVVKWDDKIIGSLMRIYNDGVNDFTLHKGLLYGTHTSWVDLLAQDLLNRDFLDPVNGIWWTMLKAKSNPTKELYDKIRESPYVKAYQQLTSDVLKESDIKFDVEITDDMLKHIIATATFGQRDDSNSIDFPAILKNVRAWESKIRNDMDNTIALREQLGKDGNVQLEVTDKSPGGIINVGSRRPINQISFQGNDVIIYQPEYPAGSTVSSKLVPVNKFMNVGNKKSPDTISVKNTNSSKGELKNRPYIALRLARTMIDGTIDYKYVHSYVESSTLNVKGKPAQLAKITDRIMNYLYGVDKAKDVLNIMNYYANIVPLADGSIKFEVSYNALGLDRISKVYAKLGEDSKILLFIKVGNEEIPLTNRTLEDVLSATYRSCDFKMLAKEGEFKDPFDHRIKYKHYQEYLMKTGALVSNAFVLKNDGKFITNASPYNTGTNSQNLTITTKPVKKNAVDSSTTSTEEVKVDEVTPIVEESSNEDQSLFNDFNLDDISEDELNGLNTKFETTSDDQIKCNTK